MQLDALSIGQRLGGGFGALLALLLATNVAAVWQLASLEKLHDKIAQQEWRHTQATELIKVTTRDNAIRTMELLFTTNRQEQDGIRRAIEHNKQKIVDALAVLSSNSDHRAQLDDLVQARTHYVASFSRVIELMDSGDRGRAIDLTRIETLPAIGAVHSAIDSLAAKQSHTIEVLGTEIKRKIQSAQILVLALVSIGLFFGIWAARAISRSITKPIDQAVQLAQQVGQGDFSGGINVQGCDEMAHLLRSLMDMNNSLVSFRLHAMLDVAIDAVIQFDQKGVITGWNTQAEQCLGWSQQDALGQRAVSLLLPTGDIDSHRHVFSFSSPSDLAAILNTRIELLARHRDGHEVPVELVVASVQTSHGTGYMAFVRDITARRQAQADSRISALAFESLEAMAVTDASGVILKVNDAYASITGYSKQEVIGKTSTIFRKDLVNRSRFHIPRESLAREGLWQGEVSDRRKNGEDYATWLRLTAVVDHSGMVTHYIVAFVDITENKLYREKIHGLSYVDTLTGLPNRRALSDRLQQILAGSERRQDYGAVLVVDLDHFKHFNDVRGREQGDLLLQRVATRIQHKMHADDLMARIDGDAFVIVLAGLDAQSHLSASKARQVAERIHLALTESFELDGVDNRITCSIGICLFGGDMHGADVIVEHAEAAMCRAKEDGRNCSRFYDPATQAALEQRFNLIAMLHKAVPNELSLYYQLQVDSSGAPLGAEALVRWQHPKMGIVSPAMFIPLAEETGLILQIGAWVLNAACDQLALWGKDSATRHLKLAVNVSAKQFLEHDFVNRVTDAIARSGADARLLKLELTENVMVSDTDAVVEKMRQLRAYGVSFSLDDFGTGYSSLAYLKKLPLEQLKIDQSFVRNLLRDANDSAIVSAVINLGQSLGLEVIAEGVETISQRNELESFGCHHFQGFLFGKPMPIKQFDALIAARAWVRQKTLQDAA